MLHDETANCSAMMTPEKEREITSKILKRAELAQMTRKLKIGLSKVTTPKKSGGVSSKSPSSSRDESGGREGSANKKRSGSDEDRRLPISETSPLKKALVLSNVEYSPSHEFEKPGTPPRGHGQSGSFNSNAIPSDGDGKGERIGCPSTPKAISAQPVFFSAQMNKHLTTPGRNVVNIDARVAEARRSSVSKSGKSKNPENETAADLLMYLATSPYVPNKIHRTPKTSQNNSHHAGHDDSDNETNTILRYSMIKNAAFSPQSTLKQPSIISHQDSSSLYVNSLMESPGVFMTNSIQQNRHQGHAPSTAGSGNANIAHFPTTPSRELQSSSSMSNAFLLKTPNFNMGDYVHSLFSPSPNVRSSTGGKFQSHSGTNSLAVPPKSFPLNPILVSQNMKGMVRRSSESQPTELRK